MRNISRLLGAALVIILAVACSSKLEYVIYRDVPQSPAFAVVPASYTVVDNRFKSEVESYLVKLGLSVIEAPLVKQPEVEVESKAQRARDEGQLHEKEKVLSIDDLVETSIVYNSSKADYVILVNAQTDVLKITRKSTQEIQAVIKYSVLDKGGSRFVKLHDVLSNLGFKIKAISEEQKIKMEYPLKEKSLMRH